jgi:hypothetical protein
MEWTARKWSGVCVTVHSAQIDPPDPNSPSYVEIQASVGLNGTNNASDVETIQDALNRVPETQGGPSGPLQVDGICGPKTRKAIQHFQLRHFGWKGADSRIDPDKQTIAKLNEVLEQPSGPGGPSAVSPDTPNITAFKAVLSAHIALARSWIRSARFELTRALPVVDQSDIRGGIPSLDRKSLMVKINRHFSVDKIPHRRATLVNILKVYDTMEQVFQRPGLIWGEKTFDICRNPKADKEHSATTSSGGYYRSGKKSYNRFAHEVVRDDTIFFIPSQLHHLAAFPNASAGVIVHELAHFVGGAHNVGRIEDFGLYGEVLKPQIQRMTPHQKIRHAEAYANFAFETATGSVDWYFES